MVEGLTIVSLAALFLSALSFGFTACIFGCMSIATPLVFKAASNDKNIMIAIAPLITGRVFGYATIAVLAFVGSLFIKEMLSDSALTQMLMGSFVVLVALIQLRRAVSAQKSECKTTLASSGIGIFAVGFLFAFTPCSAVLNLLALSLSATNFVTALAYGVIFGIGAVLGMVVLYGFLVGRIAKTAIDELQKHKKYIEYISIILLFIAGILIVSGIAKI